MGRNLVKFKKMTMSSLILKYDVIIVILMPQQLKKQKVFMFLCFWMDYSKIWCKG